MYKTFIKELNKRYLYIVFNKIDRLSHLLVSFEFSR